MDKLVGKTVFVTRQGKIVPCKLIKKVNDLGCFESSIGYIGYNEFVRWEFKNPIPEEPEIRIITSDSFDRLKKAMTWNVGTQDNRIYEGIKTAMGVI